MKFSTVFLFVAAIIFVVMVFSPEAEGRIPRRKLRQLKRAGLIALLLKGKKKILIPLPLPLPIPMLEKTVLAEPEPIAIPETYAAPEYGGGSDYGAAAAAPAYGAGGY